MPDVGFPEWVMYWSFFGWRLESERGLIWIGWVLLQHCSGINCLILPGVEGGGDGGQHLFSGSRDGTLKRWELSNESAVCGATFESHVDWVCQILHPLKFWTQFERQ